MSIPATRPALGQRDYGSRTQCVPSARPGAPGETRKATSLSSKSSPFSPTEAGPGGVKAAKRPKGVALTPSGPASTLPKGGLPTQYTQPQKPYNQPLGVLFPLNRYIGAGLKGSLPVSGSYWDLQDPGNPTGHPLGLTGPVRITAASLTVGSGMGISDVSLGGARSHGAGGVISIGLTAYRLYGWSWLLWSEREYLIPRRRLTTAGLAGQTPVMVGLE